MHYIGIGRKKILGVDLFSAPLLWYPYNKISYYKLP